MTTKKWAGQRAVRLKAYMVYNGDPSEIAWCVIAPTAKEARRLGWGLDGLDGPWTTLRATVMRGPDGRPMHLPPGVTRPGVVQPRRDAEHDRWLRLAGWHEDSASCVACDLAEFNDVPESQLCGECDYCRECGHDGDCPDA